MAFYPDSTQAWRADPEQFEEFVSEGYPSQARHGDRNPLQPRSASPRGASFDAPGIAEPDEDVVEIRALVEGSFWR